MPRLSLTHYLLFGVLSSLGSGAPALAQGPKIEVRSLAYRGVLSSSLPVAADTTLYATEGTAIYVSASASDRASVASLQLTILRGGEILQSYGPAGNKARVSVPLCGAANPCNTAPVVTLHSDGEPVVVVAKASGRGGSSQISVRYVVMSARLDLTPAQIGWDGFAQISWASRNADFAYLQTTIPGASPRGAFVSTQGSKNVSPDVTGNNPVPVTYQLFVAPRKEGILDHGCKSAWTRCDSQTLVVDPTHRQVVPPLPAPPSCSDKIWVSVLFDFDNSVLELGRVGFQFSGTYGGPIPGDPCSDQSPAEFSIDLGPYTVHPAPDVAIPIDPSDPNAPAAHYVAAVKPGVWHLTAWSPELGVTVVCDVKFEFGVSGQIIMHARDPTSTLACR